jgi:arylsulfatase A-like enzyme
MIQYSKQTAKKVKRYSLLIAAVYLTVSIACKKETPKVAPNILWIIVEDMSSHFGYQCEALVTTPHIDLLAKQGVVFENAYVTAPVCSASRSAMITGMYQTSIGAHNHRSSRGKEKIHLPEKLKTIPELFKEAGYYTCNSQEQYDKKGKEDYNFDYDSGQLYDGTDWSKRAAGQPFFAQIQLRGGKLRNVPKWQEEVMAGLDASVIVTPNQVDLPPYYPKDPIFLQDWADYLNNVSFTDLEVGKIMARLKKENLLENTVVFLITDHGISQARGKQFLYDEGTKIPFVIWAPKLLEPQINQDLISHIDMSATSLQLAGIAIPNTMEARPLLGTNYSPREFIVSARDRCDETVDHIRSVRKGNFKYIKNYLPNRPYLQPCDYKDHKPWMSVLHRLDQQGKLTETQQLVTAKTRPTEELYDLSADPYEIHNLADNKAYTSDLNSLRGLLDSWIQETGDQGMTPESVKNYDSDMEAYLAPFRRRGQIAQAKNIEANIALMKQWAKEGK